LPVDRRIQITINNTDPDLGGPNTYRSCGSGALVGTNDVAVDEITTVIFRMSGTLSSRFDRRPSRGKLSSTWSSCFSSMEQLRYLPA